MKVELFKDTDGYTIRKGTHRNFCVVDNLDKKDLASLYTRIGRVLGKVDFKKQMEKEV